MTEKKYYFVSDLHFGLDEPIEEKEREKLFVDFLYGIKNDCSELFILGDLFDYWFEYGRVMQKGYYRLFTALNDLVENGTKIHYAIGNHDFMHRSFFESDLGVQVYQDPIDITLEGKRFFLGHGDGMVKNDLGYKILKKVFRNKFAQRLYSILHPDFGIKFASSISKTSRDYTDEKDYGETDGLFEAAKEKIDAGYDYVVFGHSHRKDYKSYGKGLYINLGTWLAKPYYGCFDGDKFELLEWKFYEERD